MILRTGKEPECWSLVTSLAGMSGIYLGGVKIAFGENNRQALSDVFLTQIRDGKIAKLR